MRMVVVHCVCVCVCVCVCENHGGWFDVAKSEITLNYTVMYSLKSAYAESPMTEFMYLVIYLLKYLHKAWHERPYIVNAVKKGATIQSSKIKCNYTNFLKPATGHLKIKVQIWDVPVPWCFNVEMKMPFFESGLFQQS